MSRWMWHNCCEGKGKRNYENWHKLSSNYLLEGQWSHQYMTILSNNKNVRRKWFVNTYCTLYIHTVDIGMPKFLFKNPLSFRFQTIQVRTVHWQKYFAHILRWVVTKRYSTSACDIFNEVASHFFLICYFLNSPFLVNL